MDISKMRLLADTVDKLDDAQAQPEVLEESVAHGMLLPHGSTDDLLPDGKRAVRLVGGSHRPSFFSATTSERNTPAPSVRDEQRTPLHRPVPASNAHQHIPFTRVVLRRT